MSDHYQYLGEECFSPDDGEAEHHQLQTEREERTLYTLMLLKANGIELDSIDFLAGELGLYAAWQKYQAAHHPNLQRNPNMVSFTSMQESKFIKKEDLDQDRGNLVTIREFKNMKVDDSGDEPEYKWIVFFREFTKGMVLNATNREVLKRIYGDDTEACIGQKIVIYVDENISFAGKLVGGIRMRAPRRPAAPPVEPVQPAAPSKTADYSDDIPF